MHAITLNFESPYQKNGIIMEVTLDLGNTLVERLKKEVDNNLVNEQFGVEDLARNIGMSRSQLHRKLILETGKSVSQFIREYRLELGTELLKKKGDFTAAEIANKIGFGSPTYFSKCFKDYYGLTPGELKTKLKLNPIELASIIENRTSNWSSNYKKNVSSYIRQYRANGSQKDKSIAILPFKNLSEDQQNKYFTEGVSEAIQTSLSYIRDLRVISRTSVEQYRETNKSVRQIADELGVSALLEGSIQRNNNKVKIEVRLVDGTNEELVWAKNYERELEDVFTIQAEIAEKVAGELDSKLSVEERLRLSKTDTDNPNAYDLYLKGIYEFRTYTNVGAHNAIRLLTEAISLDSNYAKAYAFLAYSYIGLASIWGAELNATEGLDKGKPLIDKALKLDPNLDEAHMLLGFYLLYRDWNFDGAEAEYKLAIRSDHPDALAMYIDYLNFMSRHKEAMVFSERLNLKEPYYPNSRMVLSYYYNQRLDKALEFSESRITLFNNYYSLDSHGFLLLQLKCYKEAITYFNKALALEEIRYPRILGWMGASYAKLKERKNALEIISELRERFKRREGGSIAFFIAVVYSALNEKDSAISWLKTAYQSHEMEMPWLMTEPQFYPLKPDASFQELATKMGFAK